MAAVKLPPGWLPDNEVAELQRLAQGATVLELGAWKGRSTVALSRVARYVVSVDRHQGVEGYKATGVDSLPSYLDSVRGLPNVAIVVADFADFVPFLDQSFDLVFVDGDHDRDSVARDAMLADIVVVNEGVVAFHDYDMKSVRDGIAEVFDGPPDGVVGSLAWFRQ